MQKFHTPTPISTTMDIPAGHIRLIAADRTDTTVEILPADASKNRDLKAAEHTTIDYTNGILRIQTTAKNQILGPTGSIEITIQLPTDSHIKTKTASAELRAVGRFGEITFDGAHGTIKIDETTSAHLTTTAGDISIGRLTGPARINTGKGHIRITEASRGMVLLHTQAGQISVGAAPGVSASLDAGTTYGRIHNTLNNTHGTAAQLNIHASTTHGDITAHSH